MTRVSVGKALVVSMLLGGCTSDAGLYTSPPLQTPTRGASTSAATAGGEVDPTAHPAAPIGWASISNNGVSLRHPPQWRFYPFVVAGSMVTITGYLSTEVLHDPCNTTTANGAFQVSCGTPLRRLGPNGVLITLGGPDGPVTQSATTVRANSQVAGQPAVVTRGAAGESCRLIGGSYEIHVLARDRLTGAANRRVQLDACLSGPDTQTAQRAFDTLVTTIAYTGT